MVQVIMSRPQDCVNTVRRCKKSLLNYSPYTCLDDVTKLVDTQDNVCKHGYTM